MSENFQTPALATFDAHMQLTDKVHTCKLGMQSTTRFLGRSSAPLSLPSQSFAHVRHLSTALCEALMGRKMYTQRSKASLTVLPGLLLEIMTVCWLTERKKQTLHHVGSRNAALVPRSSLRLHDGVCTGKLDADAQAQRSRSCEHRQHKLDLQ